MTVSNVCYNLHSLPHLFIKGDRLPNFSFKWVPEIFILQEGGFQKWVVVYGWISKEGEGSVYSQCLS